MFASTIYIRIKPELLSVLHVESGREIADVPALAIETRNGKESVIASGADALAKSGMPNVRIENGFQHPRTVIADFTVAEATLRRFVRKIAVRTVFKPVVVIHALPALEGGLTRVEIRALGELAGGIGAREVYVWSGSELSPDQLRARVFPEGAGRVLDRFKP